MSRLVKLISSFKSVVNIANATYTQRLNPMIVRAVSTTIPRNDLMEFFDDKKNWGENEVKVGRAWRAPELRIKSNEDLHKLWYVLLKERNMLYTMEEECKQQTRLFPNPERIDKVEESMKNLETVVRERNEAYYLLETGESGERPVSRKINQFGLPYRYRATEHLIPEFMNASWREKNKFGGKSRAVSKFLSLYKEQRFVEKKKQITRDRGYVRGLFRNFKNLDEEALKKKYPHIDIEKEKKHPKSRGHFIRDD